MVETGTLVDVAGAPASLSADPEMSRPFGSSPFAAATSRGLAVKAFYLASISGIDEALVVRNGSGINSLKDLKGKKLAAAPVSWACAAAPANSEAIDKARTVFSGAKRCFIYRSFLLGCTFERYCRARFSLSIIPRCIDVITQQLPPVREA